MIANKNSTLVISDLPPHSIRYAGIWVRCSIDYAENLGGGKGEKMHWKVVAELKLF